MSLESKSKPSSVSSSTTSAKKVPVDHQAAMHGYTLGFTGPIKKPRLETTEKEDAYPLLLMDELIQVKVPIEMRKYASIILKPTEDCMIEFSSLFLKGNIYSLLQLFNSPILRQKCWNIQRASTYVLTISGVASVCSQYVGDIDKLELAWSSSLATNPSLNVTWELLFLLLLHPRATYSMLHQAWERSTSLHQQQFLDKLWATYSSGDAIDFTRELVVNFSGLMIWSGDQMKHVWCREHLLTHAHWNVVGNRLLNGTVEQTELLKWITRPLKTSLRQDALFPSISSIIRFNDQSLKEVADKQAANLERMLAEQDQQEIAEVEPTEDISPSISATSVSVASDKRARVASSTSAIGVGVSVSSPVLSATVGSVSGISSSTQLTPNVAPKNVAKNTNRVRARRPQAVDQSTSATSVAPTRSMASIPEEVDDDA
jgi:hypothetical protein